MASYVDKPTDLATHGPLVAVKLWVPEEVKPTELPIDALAEISTSVRHTCIQEGVATSLGLVPKDTVKIATLTTRAYECYVYRIRIVFPHGKEVEVNVVEVPYMLHPHTRIKCVIGRDILQLGVLTYDGRGNTFSLDF